MAEAIAGQTTGADAMTSANEDIRELLVREGDLTLILDFAVKAGALAPAFGFTKHGHQT